MIPTLGDYSKNNDLEEVYFLEQSLVYIKYSTYSFSQQIFIKSFHINQLDQITELNMVFILNMITTINIMFCKSSLI